MTSVISIKILNGRSYRCNIVHSQSNIFSILIRRFEFEQLKCHLNLNNSNANNPTNINSEIKHQYTTICYLNPAERAKDNALLHPFKKPFHYRNLSCSDESYLANYSWQKLNIFVVIICNISSDEHLYSTIIYCSGAHMYFTYQQK